MTNLSDINLSCCKSKQSWVSEHSFTKKDNLLPNLKFYKWYKFVWCKRERESAGVRRKVWLMAKDSHQPVTNRKVGIPTFVHQICLSPLECVSWRVWESSLLERCNLLMISCIRLYWMSKCSTYNSDITTQVFKMNNWNVNAMIPPELEVLYPIT